jgi:hypothetical protein
MVVKGNAQASHPSSMGPPPKKRGLFLLTTVCDRVFSAAPRSVRFRASFAAGTALSGFGTAAGNEHEPGVMFALR